MRDTWKKAQVGSARKQTRQRIDLALCFLTITLLTLLRDATALFLLVKVE
jgi:hypothetical protein